MTNKIYFLIIAICLIFSVSVRAVENTQNTAFKNVGLLDSVFFKLHELEKNGNRTVNIVHIGDSHIQADFFTGTIRNILQQRFGNAGYGFTFPYSLAKTNGTRLIKYKSNSVWQSCRNVFPTAGVNIGLSGIGFYTNTDNFLIDLSVDEEYAFRTIKLLFPEENPLFNIAFPHDSLRVSSVSTQPNTLYHKVKKGETLSAIARKYKTTVDALKKNNNLKSNTIQINQRLKIPQRASTTTHIKVDIPESSYVSLNHQKYFSVYSCDEPKDKIYIVSDKGKTNYNLSGIVLENGQAGVIYHTIGVNGAKASDYNNCPLFFEQLPLLQPDLIVLSFGTNESFGKVSLEDYLYEINRMISYIKAHNSDVPVLIMTPPPSLLRGRALNTKAQEYTNALNGMEEYPVWDLFNRMGGINAPTTKALAPLMAKDKVHYTKDGYTRKGELFSYDFLNAYDEYVSRHFTELVDNY